MLVVLDMVAFAAGLLCGMGYAIYRYECGDWRRGG